MRIGRHLGKGKKRMASAIGNEFPQASTDEAGSDKYPLATIAYYGPNDRTVTKIVVGIFDNPDSEPILEKWVGEDLLDNQDVRAEIVGYIHAKGGVHVIMTEGVIGCPHEEGIDYPLGEACPFCPFWQGR